MAKTLGGASAIGRRVATTAGFAPTPLATASRRTRTWTLVVERPLPPREGAVGHRLRLEYGLVPGRDSVQLVRAAAESFEYRVKPHELGPGRARSAKLQGFAQRLATPSAIALATMESMMASCARMAIDAAPRELPVGRARIGE